MTVKKRRIISIVLCALSVAFGGTIMGLSTLTDDKSLSTLCMVIGVIFLVCAADVLISAFGMGVKEKPGAPKNITALVRVSYITPLAVIAVAGIAFGVHFASGTAAVYVALAALFIEIIMLSACTYYITNASVRVKMQQDREETERELTEIINKRYAELEEQKKRDREINEQNNKKK